MDALVAELRERTDAGRGRRRAEGDRAAPLPRKASRARADRPALRSRHRVSRAERARRLGSLRRRRAGRGHRHRDRRRRGPGVRARRERRDRQGRHVLPADGEEAPARPGGGGAERPPVHLPGGLGRRVPAAPGRGVPRPGALRPHLLQPGAHVRGEHPADRARHGLLHRGRRVRPGDERRDGDREGHRDDLPRRPAAREGGDRRGGDRGGARRRRRALPRLRRDRPLRDQRRARARARRARSSRT